VADRLIRITTARAAVAVAAVAAVISYRHAYEPRPLTRRVRPNGTPRPVHGGRPPLGGIHPIRGSFEPRPGGVVFTI
jgi:hypothetical protein